MHKINIISLYSDPFAGYDAPGSGINIFVKNIGKALAENGNEVHFISRKYLPNTKTEKLIGENQWVHYIETNKIDSLSRREFADNVDSIRNHVLNYLEKHDIANNLFYTHYWLNALCFPPEKKKLQLHSHHSLNIFNQDKNSKRYSIEKEITQKALTICNSEEELNQITSNYGKPNDLILSPAGVDFDLFQPKKKDIIREKLSIPKDKFVVAFAGRFVENKGIFDLIEAINNFSKIAKNNSLFLFIGGRSTPEEQENKQKLTEFINSNSLQSIVKLTGVINHSQIGDYFAAADAVVMPSHYEPFGLVAVEAMASGTPVIASNVGGLKSTIRDGINGFHVDPNSPNQISEKLEQLYRNKRNRIEMGQKAFKIVKEEYSWNILAKKITNFLTNQNNE